MLRQVGGLRPRGVTGWQRRQQKKQQPWCDIDQPPADGGTKDGHPTRTQTGHRRWELSGPWKEERALAGLTGVESSKDIPGRGRGTCKGAEVQTVPGNDTSFARASQVEQEREDGR